MHPELQCQDLELSTKQSIDSTGISRIQARLGEVAVDPTRWRDLLEDMCLAVGAAGASLRQEGIRTADVPYTSSMEDLTKIYFKEGWHLRDIRVPLFQSVLASRPMSAFCDADILTHDEMHRLFRRDAYFNDFLRLGKLRWGGWIRFPVKGQYWLIAFQRTAAQGAFERQDIVRLSPLAQALTEVADLSAAVGHSALTGVLDGLHLVQQPALALDRNGVVLGMNSGADAVFDPDFRVHNSRLLIRDGKARIALERLVAQASMQGNVHLQQISRPGNVIIARREARKPIVMRLLPVHGAASAPFIGAKFILTLTDLDIARKPSLEIVSEAFLLTAVEAKVASMVAAGSSPEEIAAAQNVSRETVRNQIKAVFAKTGTHRQSELAALLSRIRG